MHLKIDRAEYPLYLSFSRGEVVLRSLQLCTAELVFEPAQERLL